MRFFAMLATFTKRTFKLSKTAKEFRKPFISNVTKLEIVTRCLKITEKVAFDIASVASYVYT